ncbi:hypothetical protein ABEB36_006928 [Hypothenemus hampei]|uniref:Ribosomal protein S6 kinase delta-1 n=1 Tax=Hypothenemus hampei TaxID=57062 RepID=A0ABD1ES53_HYPHA
MNSNPTPETWVRMFDIADVSKHKNGFTIYKIVSFLYPESCPDAVTKMIVWKRYNDFKMLHKEIKALHKKLNLKDELPSLPKSVLFKRFDEETINQRKRGILNFLEYIGSHSALFTSLIFVKFFEVGHTPLELLNGNINTIRADLHLPEDPDFSLHNSDDDDKIYSDTDSFTSSGFSVPQVTEATIAKTSLRKLSSMTSIDSHSSRASETVSICHYDPGQSFFDGHGSPSEITQYLINANMHVNMAVELENEKHYEEAYSAYKTAVDILMSGVKEDPDYDRKRLVRYKTEKYLIKAEKIYNMYLAPEIKDLQLQTTEETENGSVIKGPLYNLYKYKVIKIISTSGMLVLHSEEQQLYFVKVIRKPVQFSNSNLVLPRNVPYMVKLINHFNTENSIFLVLEYSSAIKLRNLLENKSTSLADDNIIREINNHSDNETEMSFSELFNAYTSNEPLQIHENEEGEDDDCGFEKIEMPHEEEHQVYEDGLSYLSEISNDFELGDDLEHYRSSISENNIVKWASQLLVAIEKLHSLGVVCRDLNMDNVLIDENSNVLLTYMCNTKEMCSLYTKEENLNLAPEMYSFEEITESADWWSFGAILYELLIGKSLSETHVNGITSYTHLVIPKYVSSEGKSLLKQLLIWDPEERLGSQANGIQHLKAHPFFKGVNWSLIEKTS